MSAYVHPEFLVVRPLLDAIRHNLDGCCANVSRPAKVIVEGRHRATLHESRVPARSGWLNARYRALRRAAPLIPSRQRDRVVAGAGLLAVEAAALIGNGLYGVDIKETPNGPVVIEINDNPSIETGYEDQADKERIYEDIVDTFVGRIAESARVEAR